MWGSLTVTGAGGHPIRAGGAALPGRPAPAAPCAAQALPAWPPACCSPRSSVGPTRLLAAGRGASAGWRHVGQQHTREGAEAAPAGQARGPDDTPCSRQPHPSSRTPPAGGHPPAHPPTTEVGVELGGAVLELRPGAGPRGWAAGRRVAGPKRTPAVHRRRHLPSWDCLHHAMQCCKAQGLRCKVPLSHPPGTFFPLASAAGGTKSRSPAAARPPPGASSLRRGRRQGAAASSAATRCAATPAAAQRTRPHAP